jgi:hypothetical protein
VLADLTFADMIQVGLGPSFDYILYNACGPTSCVDAGTIGVAADARVALSFDSSGRRQALISISGRSGFSLELNLHVGAYGFDNQVFGYGQVGVGAAWIMY